MSAPALGEFATAITSRYNGAFEGLPRVKFWMVWNEPNLSSYLAPQVSGKKLVGAARYRSMVNAFASAAHAVRRDNMVVAGLVAPFTFRKDPGPLKFMKAVLSGRTEFDIWAVHPYTSGGPRHHAVKSTDVSLGDLPKARSVLNAAVRARHVVSTHPVQFWVTEFSWDSKPPDPRGVPLGTGGPMGLGGAFPRLAGRGEHVHLVPAQGRASRQHAVPVGLYLPQRERRSRL